MCDREGQVAVIPARGGSKRLPGKNMRKLVGKPLIQWSIDAAFSSQCFEKIMVTSDSDEVLSLAESLGCYCVKRPPELASDTSPTYLALCHAVDMYRQNSGQIKQLMLLQPTSPLREEDDICAAVALKKETHASSVISVCETEHSPLWCNTLDAEQRMDQFLSQDILNKRSQDLPVYYRLNGAIYLADMDAFIKQKGFFMPNSRALVMPPERSVDIDNDIDFCLAECLLARELT